jgi:G3E family GTPase
MMPRIRAPKNATPDLLTIETIMIPTTILTGFLGAGKTTLLNRLLKEPHGHKIAVIENEFGAENIDNEILVQDSTEQIVEMNNGCICCTVRGDLISALSSLAIKRNAGELAFDHVVIETTGLANPGPVAQTFFMDEEVSMHYRLDAIVTVVDARHGMQQFDQREEAQRQVGFADRILLSKTDLCSAEEVAQLSTRLKRMNPRARITTNSLQEESIASLLDLRGFNLNDKLEIDPEFLAAQEHAHDHADCGHDHAHGEGCSHEHGHTDDISAFVFRSKRPFDAARLDNFLGGLIQVFGPRMLRYKGILYMEGADRKVVFQGVHQTMGSDLGAPWLEQEERGSKMVFIGVKLPQDTFVQGLEQCLV